MWNAGLDESQAGIKIARRNINNLRYADDTTLMAESEEKLKSLLMRLKEESEKATLKPNIEKPKIMALRPQYLMANRRGKHLLDKSTGVGCHFLLQEIFPNQGSSPGLPHCRRILYHLNHQGSLWILQWVAYPFSRGTSQPKNQTRVSCIAGFFTSWPTREAHFLV